MDLERLIREADPVRRIEPVDVRSDDAQALYRQIVGGRSELRRSVPGPSGSGSDLDGPHRQPSCPVEEGGH
jgi:hypothetical protein